MGEKTGPRKGENLKAYRKNFRDINWAADTDRVGQWQRHIINAPNWGREFIPDRVPRDKL